MKTVVSVILIVAVAGSVCFAQNYNFSFENWLDHGTFEEPEYWGTFNPVAIVGVQAHKDTDAVHGNFALKLATQAIPAGVAVLGTINPSSGLIKPGRPYTQRPEKVTCWYKTKLINGDSSAIVFNLTKYDPVLDSTIQVGFAGMIFYHDVPDWTLLELDFEYYTADVPDTLGIILAATANADGIGNPGCELSVDGIQFTQPATSAASVHQRAIRFYPNPVEDVIKIESREYFHNSRLVISDVSGKEVYSSPFVTGKQISVASFPKGYYSLYLKNAASTEFIGRFLKN